MQTVYGILADEHTIAKTQELMQDAAGPRLRTRAWASPASAYANEQDPVLIDLEHDQRWCGEVVYLERDQHSRLWAVGHVRDHVSGSVPVRVGMELRHVETPLYWSASRFDNDGDLLLESVALTRSPARLSPRPVTIVPGELDFRGCTRRWADRLDRNHRELLERAADYHVPRRGDRQSPLRIHDAELRNRDLDHLTPAEQYILLSEQYDQAWRNRPLRRRPGTILSVR